MGGVTGALVGQGGRVGGQLDGGHLGVALADGRLQLQALAVVFVGGVGQVAGGLAQLKAGLGGKAQAGCHLVEVFQPHPAAHVIEIDVAAVGQGLGQVGGAAVGAQLLAHGLVVGVEVVHAGAVHRVLGGHDAAQQARQRHRRLEGGAGGVQAGGCPAQQRGVGIRAVGAVIGLIQVQIVAGVVGNGQNPAGFHVDDHRRAGGDLLALGGLLGLLHLQNQGLQLLVQALLQVLVDGQHHRLAGLGVHQHLGAHHHAALVAAHLLGAFLAPQPVLGVFFHAGLADQVVHVVARVL